MALTNRAASQYVHETQTRLLLDGKVVRVSRRKNLEFLNDKINGANHMQPEN